MDFRSKWSCRSTDLDTANDRRMKALWYLCSCPVIILRAVSGMQVPIRKLRNFR